MRQDYSNRRIIERTELEGVLAQKKLTTMLSILSDRFIEKQIPFCLIGAFALGFYGLSRHTVDIDFMVDANYGDPALEILTGSGYTCFQKTELFAQFDSEYDVFGKVDMMFASTDAGREMIRRSVLLDAELIGRVPVVQPTDYIILKLLAIANDKERLPKDEFDISEFFKGYRTFGISEKFEKIDAKRIYRFAEKFGQTGLIQKYMATEK